jgi:hypothetical protein
MAGIGPPPNPNAKRTNPRVGMIRLPASGRPGRTPKWPLPDNPNLVAEIETAQTAIDELEERLAEKGKLTGPESAKLTRMTAKLARETIRLEAVQAAETEIWRELWRSPQAVAWEQLGFSIRVVAQYVRWKAMAEMGDLDAGREARQCEDRLGLNPRSMRSLMWTISEDEVDAKRTAKKAPAKKAAPRLRAVDGV